MMNVIREASLIEAYIKNGDAKSVCAFMDAIKPHFPKYFILDFRLSKNKMYLNIFGLMLLYNRDMFDSLYEKYNPDLNIMHEWKPELMKLNSLLGTVCKYDTQNMAFAADALRHLRDKHEFNIGSNTPYDYLSNSIQQMDPKDQSSAVLLDALSCFLCCIDSASFKKYQSKASTLGEQEAVKKAKSFKFIKSI